MTCNRYTVQKKWKMKLQTTAVGPCNVFFFRQEASRLERPLKRRLLPQPTTLPQKVSTCCMHKLILWLPRCFQKELCEVVMAGEGAKANTYFNKTSGVAACGFPFFHFWQQPHAELQTVSPRLATKGDSMFLTLGLLIPIGITRFTLGCTEADDGEWSFFQSNRFSVWCAVLTECSGVSQGSINMLQTTRHWSKSPFFTILHAFRLHLF